MPRKESKNSQRQLKVVSKAMERSKMKESITRKYNKYRRLKVKCLCNNCNGKLVDQHTKKFHEKKEESKPKRQKVQDKKSKSETSETSESESSELSELSESSESSESESEPSWPSAKKVTSKKTKTRADISSASRKRSFAEDPQDPQDPVAIKRAQNTAAARRSRERKLIKMNNLEKQVSELTNENIQLKTYVAVLEAEKESFKGKDLDKVNRIKALEDQLVEAHQKIIGMSNMS